MNLLFSFNNSSLVGKVFSFVDCKFRFLLIKQFINCELIFFPFFGEISFKERLMFKLFLYFELSEKGFKLYKFSLKLFISFESFKSFFIFDFIGNFPFKETSLDSVLIYISSSFFFSSFLYLFSSFLSFII